MDFKRIPTSDLLVKKNFSLRGKNANALCRLVKSIRTYGLQIPLLVRPEEGGYAVIDGKLRLLAWKHIGRDQTIPCIVVDSDVRKMDELEIFQDVAPFTKEENAEHIRDLYLSVAVNLVRLNVDHACLRKIVQFLHSELHLGYGTIAQRIGYSKAGVQKMLKRMEAKKECATATSSPPNHVLRRLRTELKKLAETIPSTSDDADKVMGAIRCLNEYLDSLIQSA